MLNIRINAAPRGAAFIRGRRLLIFWLSGAAFIWGRRLFEGGVYSRKYGMQILALSYIFTTISVCENVELTDKLMIEIYIARELARASVYWNDFLKQSLVYGCGDNN